jgi:DMSO/TMAO reductase YedYZ molybdopterin-dependent catalytic subunit
MQSERKLKHDPDAEQRMAAHSRRGFLTLGLAGAAGYSGFHWLRSRPSEDGLPWPFRRSLEANESIAKAWYSSRRQTPTFAASEIQQPRVNGDIGLGDDFTPGEWMLRVDGLDGKAVREFTLATIRELPKVEQITELNCIEGWTRVQHWAGVRFSDFTARHAPESLRAQFVNLQTPDDEYFVGLDMASALHSQTLLCYELNGQPLSTQHGAPLRLVIPVKYGVKSIKRIGRIEYTNERPEDYWGNQGYDWYAGL